MGDSKIVQAISPEIWMGFDLICVCLQNSYGTAIATQAFKIYHFQAKHEAEFWGLFQSYKIAKTYQ